MRLSVQEQIHRSLVAEEEAHGSALEAQKGKPVKRRHVRAWKRPGPEHLTQDPELLVRITEFSYDLEKKGFQKYCEGRGVLHVAGQRGSRRWLYMSDTRKDRDQFLSDPSFQYAQEHHGQRYKYTDEEMATAWRIVQLGRAALEDAWDLYRRRGRSAPKRLRATGLKPRTPRKRKASKPPKRMAQQGSLF
jgi:hypothetical protein